jgi:MFS family permease
VPRLIPAILREREFRLFWIGQSISVLGDQVTLLALPVVAVLVLRADAASMGLLTAIGLLPHLLFSLPAGVLLDRVRKRRRLMILADVGRAILIASIPVAYALDALSLAQLLVTAFLVGVLAVGFDISWATVFVAVARREQYVVANALLNGSRSVAQVGGPAIGGILIQVLSASVALAVDAVSFVLSALSLARIRAVEAAIEAEVGTIRERLFVGLRFIGRDPIMLRVLVSVALVNLFNFAFQALFILYVTTRLGVSPGVLGLALGAGAVGGVLGALIAERLGRRLGFGPAYALGLVVFPAALIPVALVTGPPPAVIAMLFGTEFVAGLGVMILDINVGAVILARTPDRIRGRATGAFRFVNYGIRPIGALLGGALGAALGVRETLLVVSVAGLIGPATLFRSAVLGLRDLPEAAELGPEMDAFSPRAEPPGLPDH